MKLSNDDINVFTSLIGIAGLNIETYVHTLYVIGELDVYEMIMLRQLEMYLKKEIKKENG